MIKKTEILKSLYLNTYGWIATASLLICAFSGILLAIPFDINQPFITIANWLISSPAASFTRNIHYWSAQSFLVFSILHIVDQLLKKSEHNLRKSLWLRLTISILFIGYAMLSGFFLKADPDSQQAARILASLLESIPFAGKMLRATFVGSEGNLHMVYVQHISMATLIVFLAVFDHVKTIWVNLKTFLTVLAIISVISFFFTAPLGTINDSVMKGPWYFVGLQELMHWIGNTRIIIALSLVIIILISLLPYVKHNTAKIIRISLLLSASVYLLLTLTGLFFRGEEWKWEWPWNSSFENTAGLEFKPLSLKVDSMQHAPVILGQPEACLICHSGMKGLSLSHSESNIGCYSCHQGDPFTLNKNQAHRNMLLVPGNLSNAEVSCGSPSCHPAITQRVSSSLMNNLTGMIQVDRYAFKETSDLNGDATIHMLGKTAADTHLKNLCITCHLGSEKNGTGPQAWLNRGGGCNACHLTYRQEALDDWNKQRKSAPAANRLPLIHPSIDLSISNAKCYSCHSRSGRISLNYEGWHETTVTAIPSENKDKFRKLPDGRILTYVAPDIHHEKGLNCIDCHSSFELMGDGKKHSHMEDAVNIQCSDCHPTDKPVNTIVLNSTDKETQLTAWLRGYKDSNASLITTEKGNQPLVNSRIFPNGDFYLLNKLSGAALKMKSQSESCLRGNAHDRLSCNACHSAWVPQCIGCHNSFESKTIGFDGLNNKFVKGSWIEYAGISVPEPPTLGVNSNENQIQTYAPGMILTIDKSSFEKNGGKIFQRLFAPASAHTTRKESRSCISCHNDPLALGLGRGQLTYLSGKWRFSSKYSLLPQDGLPEDAWTGFLSKPSLKASTRKGHRPFDAVEQKKILTVGACLTCHTPESAVMKESLIDFRAVLKKTSKNCILPVWGSLGSAK
ncbi:MAG: cytochrome b N-terminal domain-containing protein [Bacteroidales bacterium]|nr:cytochrome b N-terminal domain-containing protein [Bacteroidales bacterium]